MVRHLSILVGLIWLAPVAAHGDQIISDTIQDGVRTIVGVQADANYQVALPLSGDGSTLLYVSHHFAGDENSSNSMLKPLALARGWIYVASSEGYDHVSLHQDRWKEARQRIIQVVGKAQGFAHSQYGVQPTFNYIAGFSMGGHHTKWMIEDSNAFQAGLSLAGATSVMEWVRWIAFYARTYDGTPASVENFSSNVSGFVFDQGLKPSYGPPIEQSLTAIFAPFLTDTARQKLNPEYVGTPNPESGWDPDIHMPRNRVIDVRKMDETGILKTGTKARPLILIHGGSDAIVSPGCSIAYQNLVRQKIGIKAASEVLKVFIIPNVTHFHFFEGASDFLSPTQIAEGMALMDEGLTKLDEWTRLGVPPSTIGGVEPY